MEARISSREACSFIALIIACSIINNIVKRAYLVVFSADCLRKTIYKGKDS